MVPTGILAASSGDYRAESFSLATSIRHRVVDADVRSKINRSARERKVLINSWCSLWPTAPAVRDRLTHALALQGGDDHEKKARRKARCQRLHGRYDDGVREHTIDDNSISTATCALSNTVRQVALTHRDRINRWMANCPPTTDFSEVPILARALIRKFSKPTAAFVLV